MATGSHISIRVPPSAGNSAAKPAAMKLDNVLADIQAEAHNPQKSPFMRLIKTINNIPSTVQGNAHATIHNTNPDHVIRVPDPLDPHRAAFRTVFDGVRHQVRQHLFQSQRIHICDVHVLHLGDQCMPCYVRSLSPADIWHTVQLSFERHIKAGMVWLRYHIRNA